MAGDAGLPDNEAFCNISPNMLDVYRIARGNALLVLLLLVFSAVYAGGGPFSAPAATLLTSGSTLPAPGRVLSGPDGSLPAAAPTISAHPQSFSTCINDPGQALTVSANGSGPLSYSWQQKSGTAPWETIEEATGSSYTPSTRRAGTTFYRVRVTSADGSSIYSNAATVTIYRPPSFSISAPADAVCLNTTLNIRTGIDENVWDLEWEKSIDSVNWLSTGVHDPQISHPTSSTGTTWYRLKVTPRGMPNPICSPISAPVTVTVRDCMALAVSKSASAREVSAGDPLTYTIRLTNRGPSPLLPGQVITFREELPEGLNVKSVTAEGSLDLEAQTWTGIALQPGESTTVTIEGAVPSDYTGDPFLNRVTVVPPAEVKNTSRADSLAQTITNVLRTADLEIAKTSLQSSVKAGQALQYTITVTNKGPSRILPTDAFNVQEELPAGFRIRNYQAGEGVFNYLTGDWTEVDLAAGEQVTLTVYGFVDSRFEGTSITNSSSLIPPTEVTDPVLPNNASVTVPVSREADLEITKGGPGSMAPNETIWYTVRVANKGPSYAAGVLITDAVPEEIAVESWTADPGRGAQILSGKEGTGNDVEVSANIPAGSEVIIRIRGTVRPGGDTRVENIATAIPPPDIPDPTIPNTANHATDRAGSDQLLLRKRGPATAVPGRRISYTVQLINNSSSTLNAIQFGDMLTAGTLDNVTWIATPNDPGITMSQKTGNSLPIQFEAAIPSEKKITIIVTGTVPAGFTGEIINVANAVAGDETAGDTATTRVHLPASVELVKTGPAEVNAGSDVTYTISATNTGGGAAGEVVISDRLPLGSIFLESDGGTYHPNYHSVSWPLIALEPGASVEHSIIIRAPADAPEITNTANAGAKSDAVVTTITPATGLSVTKEAPDSVYQEETFLYIILARNKGPSTARDITVTDAVPAELEILDAGGGTVNGHEITWNISSLPRNGVHRFTVEVKAPAQSLELSNTVSIHSATPDPDASDNSFSAITRVLPASDLLVEKTGPAEAYAGEEVSYQLTVTNQGPSPAANVSITDRLPSGMQFVSSDVPPVDTLANPVNWVLPVLGTGESKTITVRVKVPGRVGAARNIAEVTSDYFDENTANNRSTFTTQVTPAADVEVIKEGTAAIDSAGIIRYEILVRNNGPSTALDVNFADELPANLGAPLSISNGGAYDAAAHRITWSALPAMAAGTERLLTVRVGVKADAGIVMSSNTATIASRVFDPDTANNRSVFETYVYPPADVFFNLNPDRVCRGQTVTLAGGGVRNNVPGTEVYSGPGVSEGQFHSEGLDPGDYEITYTFTTPAGTVKQLRDTLHLLPAAFADAGPDREILEGDSIVLEARATGEVVNWTPTESLNDPTVVRAVAAPAETTTYRLTAENPGMCSAYDEVTVYVYPRLEIPNAFTPNNDAVNDTWRIFNIEKYPDATVQVFNRNGDQLFFSRGYAEEWEGDFNNEPVPAGTYYYLIRPNGGILKPATGSVTIIR